MHVLVAADKFKDALSAPAACAAIAAGLQVARPDWTVELCPLTDGGEGFARILTEIVGGEWIPCKVAGPRGAPVTAGFGLVRAAALPPVVRARLGGPVFPDAARLAVIEMASASGLALLQPEERDVWRADTRGTGELLAAAAELGVAGILLGVGGSATHDLGLGALTSLGLRLRDARDRETADCAPDGWSAVERVDLGGLRKLPPLWIACDVTNPLLGPSGAATVYGPQKGLSAESLTRLEAESARVAGLLAPIQGSEDLTKKPGAGAAGGIAFGLMAAAGARLVSGFDLVSEWLALDVRLGRADLVITGEGRFDESSLSGKGPGALVRAACGQGRQAHVFAGRVDVRSSLPGLRLHEISSREVALAEALAQTEARLSAAVAQVFAEWGG